MIKRIPAESFPPGEYIKDELEARGWSQADFAQIIGRDAKAVSMILSGKTRITEETAKLLEAALDLDAQYWLNLESAYRLGLARESTVLDSVTRRAKLYEKYPVSQLVKQGWIESSDNLSVLEHRVLAFHGISNLGEVPRFAHAAKKCEEPQKQSLQLAWLYRSEALARALPILGFTSKKLELALEQLRTLLTNPEEVRHVPRVLHEAGIRYVVVEALPGSKIDGACYWIDNNPVIAMTLRFDRIDNFWFVLLHELRHIANNHGKELPILDVNLREQPVQNSQEEDLVNLEAEQYLIPSEQLNDFVVRVKPVFSHMTVTGFARRLGVHPGILVGQLHYKKIIPYSYHVKYLTKVRHIICSTALCDGWGTKANIRISMS